jgi:hypothetical protein
MGLPNLAFHLIDENIETMTLADSNVYKREVEGSWLVFDIEQSLPSIETAITSGFTVLENNGVAQAAYYSGYATSHVQPMRLAHSEFGWNTVSLFGREPSEKNWRIIGDLSKPMVDPLKWERYGRRIFEESAYLHANIYLTRWDPRNVASQLATLDANLGIIETSTVRPKHAMIPVLSTSFLSSGGECKNSTDPTWRWYTGLPISDEEARMTTASVFFSQVAGMGVWSSPSETPNGYLPGSMVPGRSFLIDVHTGSLPSPLLDSLGNPVALKKYDALFVRERMASNGKIQIRFEILPKNLENFTARQIQALNTCRDHNDISEVRQYTVDESALLPLLRAETKPIAAMFEGIALIQPIEPLLFFGVPENEVSARTLFGVYDGSLDPSTGKLNQGSPALPIVRHKVLRYYAPDTSGNHTILKKLHILLTYNPQLLYKDDYCSGQNENRCKILLPNFSGVEGRDVSLWADLTPRIYLLQE